MKTETTISTYRGHDIHTTQHTTEGATNSWFTQENDVTSSGTADLADDEAGHEHTGTITQRIYATKEKARADAEADIESTLGPAEREEITEAAYDLASGGGPQWEERNAKRLADAITSHLTQNPDANDLARTLREIAKAATHQ